MAVSWPKKKVVEAIVAALNNSLAVIHPDVFVVTIVSNVVNVAHG